MKTKRLVLFSLFLGIGAVLHLIIPGFFFGMKPDMMLVMLFLGILLYPELKTAALLGIGTGILAALTTTFPGGQLPNFFEKIITAFLILSLITLVKKVPNRYIKALVATSVGTVISGSTFLVFAMIIAELPVPFNVLFVTVVLPAILLNTGLMAAIFPIADKMSKLLK